jgi:hypothetical protein
MMLNRLCVMAKTMNRQMSIPRLFFDNSNPADNINFLAEESGDINSTRCSVMLELDLGHNLDDSLRTKLQFLNFALALKVDSADLALKRESRLTSPILFLGSIDPQQLYEGCMSYAGVMLMLCVRVSILFCDNM